MTTVNRLFAMGRVYKVGSAEYEALMSKWSRESFAEELEADRVSYAEHEDMMGRKVTRL